MRYLYFCLLAVVTGLPAFAKTSPAPAQPANFSSKGGKSTCLAPVPDKGKVKPKVVSVTPDVPRQTQRSMAATSEAAAIASTAAPVGNGPILGNRLVAYPAPASARSTVSAAANGFAAGMKESTQDISGAGRLARVTAYWAGEGDYYTGRRVSATGVHLHDGHCAVDPNIIPYGSIVEIPGLGKFLAVDTGSAVVSRTAAKESGHNSAERAAIVIDLFFDSPSAGERFAAGVAKFTAIKWWTPTSSSDAKAHGSLIAEEDWTKIQGKQL